MKSSITRNIDMWMDKYCYTRKDKTVYILKKIKNNFGMLSALFGGAWFLITLFCYFLLYLLYMQYFKSIGLDMSFFSYNEVDLRICLFTSMVVVIFLLLLLYLFYLKNYIFLFIIASGVFNVADYINKLQGVDNNIRWILFYFSRMFGVLALFLAIMLVVHIAIEKIERLNKYERWIFSGIRLVFFICSIFIFLKCTIDFVVETGKSYLYFNDTVQLAYEENIDGNQEYYIVLWCSDSLMYMKNIDYKEEQNELIVNAEYGIITTQFDKYKYFIKQYSNIILE